MNADPNKVLDVLRDPRLSLPRYATLIDQRTGQRVLYDAYAITHQSQATVVSYVADPPINVFGQKRWLVALKARQAGLSLATELAYYTKTAYTVGHDHVTIADTNDRANYLHQRVHLSHTYWPAELRAETISNRESRQITFLPQMGGKMRTLSAEQGGVGIGQSPDSLHGSEVPFWSDAAGAFNLILPSMINRDHASMVLESTAAPKGYNSVDWWRDICREARQGVGRWLYAFFPFWDGKLNRRPWPDGSQLDSEEQKFMELYAHQGLTLENLAFRRYMMEMDPEVRRNPGLFNVFFPFDDLTCWQSTEKGAIHPKSLAKHKNKVGLYNWEGPYMEYEPPEVGAKYVIGADGAGWGVRDHASFQVLKIYAGEWTQVACFADAACDPVVFTQQLMEAGKRYNLADIVVESNGVGAGPLSLLLAAEYKNLYFEESGKPGKTSTGKSVDEMLGYLVDALLDELVLNDKDTVDQLESYKNDKRVEDGATAEQLRGKIGRGRRARHHWDKVSALKMAVVGARESVQPKKKVPQLENNVLMFTKMSYNQQQEFFRQVEKDKEKGKRKKIKYRPVKRR